MYEKSTLVAGNPAADTLQGNTTAFGVAGLPANLADFINRFADKIQSVKAEIEWGHHGTCAHYHITMKEYHNMPQLVIRVVVRGLFISEIRPYLVTKTIGMEPTEEEFIRVIGPAAGALAWLGGDISTITEGVRTFEDDGKGCVWQDDCRGDQIAILEMLVERYLDLYKVADEVFNKAIYINNGYHLREEALPDDPLIRDLCQRLLNKVYRAFWN